MTPKAIAIISLGLALYIVWVIFSSPIQESYEETYYTSEPIVYEVSFIRERQVTRWIFWDATEVQYFVKNTDAIEGEFTLNFVFSNQDETKTITRKIKILAGAQEAVTEGSPLWGVSSGKLNVVSSDKQVPHKRLATRNVYIWDRLGDLKSLFGLK